MHDKIGKYWAKNKINKKKTRNFGFNKTFKLLVLSLLVLDSDD